MSTLCSNVVVVASGNTFQRLNCLGVTQTNWSSPVGYTFNPDISQMDYQKLIAVKYVSQGLICDDTDSENV